MEILYRCFFRLGIVILLAFVVFRNFRGFPLQTEAVIRAAGTGRYHSSRSYNSMYPGRYSVWKSFGRSSGSRRKHYEPVDSAERNRLYYQKKMAEWREKNKLPEDVQNYPVNSDEDSAEYDYDYDEATTVPDTATAETFNETSSDPLRNGEENVTEDSLGSPTTEEARTEETTTTSEAPAQVTETKKPSRAYGLRYGRVKVETLS